MDLTGVDLTGKNLEDVDFSQCTGLTGEQLAKASYIDYSTSYIYTIWSYENKSTKWYTYLCRQYTYNNPLIDDVPTKNLP